MTLAGAVRVANKSGEDYENAQVRLVVGVIRLVEELATLAHQSDRADTAKLSMNFSGVPPVMLQAYRALGEADQMQLKRMEAGHTWGLTPKEIVKEGLSEYFLYTVEGRDTIPTGWSKRLPSFKTADVPITSYYKFEKERWGDQVMRYYQFTNSEPSKLGKEPLPDGEVKAFRVVTDDNLYSFVGRTTVKYIPVS